MRPEQSMKAHASISVTEPGMCISVRLEQPPKADAPMVVTPSGMTVFLQPETSLCSSVLIMALEPSGELYTVLPASTVMLANAGQ